MGEHGHDLEKMSGGRLNANPMAALFAYDGARTSVSERTRVQDDSSTPGGSSMYMRTSAWTVCPYCSISRLRQPPLPGYDSWTQPLD